MAMMNPLLAMATDVPDFGATIANGQRAYQQQQEFQQSNALSQALQQYGPAAMSGDKNALEALSRFDPRLSLGVMGDRQQMDLRGKADTRDATESSARMADASARLDMARQETAQAVRLNSLKISDAERTEALAKISPVANAGMIAYKQGPEAWDRWNDSDPRWENVSYEDAPMALGEVLGAVDGLMPEEPKGYDFEGETDLRKEFTALPPVKSFQVQADAFGKVAAAASDPSAAGDLALIFSFMKILDPNSVVREQEFANAQNAAGVPDQVRNAWNRALNGERLNPEQRADFLKTAQATYEQSAGQIKSISDQYGSIADERGLDRGRTLPSFNYAGEMPQAGASADVPQQGPTQIKTVDEYNALPSGTEYISPDGKHKVKR